MTTLDTTGDDTRPDHVDNDQFTDETDEEFLPKAKERLGPVTLSLIALLIVTLGFLGGIVTQKHSSSSSGRSSGTGGFNAANFAGLGGGSGRRAGGGTQTGTGSGTSGGGQGSFGGGSSDSTGSSSGASSDDSGPAVIGTVVSVSGDTAIVKNLGGKQITVHLGTDTTISKPGTAADLQPGTTVTVSGSSESDGSVTATAVQTK